VPEAAEQLSRVKRAILGCTRSCEGISTVRVECLGGLSALDLVVLAVAARPPELRVNLAFCSGCAAGPDVVPVVQDRVEEAARVVGRGRITAFSDSRDADMTPRQAERRGLLRSLLAPVVLVARQVPAGPSERSASRTALRDIPERRRWVLERTGDLPRSSTLWLLARTPCCDDCCRCAGVCPTGALARPFRDGRRVLEIATERCTGCHACLDFCPKDGLALSPRAEGR
jgi:ferredoxin